MTDKLISPNCDLQHFSICYFSWFQWVGIWKLCSWEVAAQGVSGLQLGRGLELPLELEKAEASHRGCLAPLSCSFRAECGFCSWVGLGFLGMVASVQLGFVYNFKTSISISKAGASWSLMTQSQKINNFVNSIPCQSKESPR